MSTASNNTSGKSTSGNNSDGKGVEIHSANKWENANLGDDDRKKKFLRLMGAAKKDHQGKIVIGDQEKSHERTDETTKEINENLEEQFIEALEHKKVSGYKGHLGLGFHQGESDTANTNQNVSQEGNSESNKEKNEENTSRKHKLDDPSDKKTEDSYEKKTEETSQQKEDNTPSDCKKKKMMMNFVKASS